MAILGLVLAVLVTFGWGIILGIERRFWLLAGSVPLGAVAYTGMSVWATSAQDDCLECYPGLLLLPACVVLAMLLAGGGAIGSSWRARKIQSFE